MMDDESEDRSLPPTRLVNGVFAGGGAKAIAYAGAFQALEDRGIWFGSVAGTSAGAIAAALVASGMRSKDFDQAIPIGLAALKTDVPRRLAKAAAGHAHSVFDSAKLRDWLDETLRARIGPGDGPGDGPAAGRACGRRSHSCLAAGQAYRQARRDRSFPAERHRPQGAHCQTRR